jgi:outer membrane lipoprotein SlyB
MPLTAQEAFKVGFLARCVEDGLGRWATDVGIGYGVPLAAAAPWVAGGAAGYGLARATDISDTDVGEIKDRELMSEYRRQTDQLLRQRAVRDYARAVRQSGRVFGQEPRR